MSDHDDFGAFLLGFLTGGIAGAVVALLFAPQSGEETRRLIKEKAIDLQEKASNTLEDALADAERGTKEALRKAELAYNEAKARFEAIVNRKKIALESPNESDLKQKKAVKPAVKTP
jgi:gas vesicle protein